MPSLPSSPAPYQALSLRTRVLRAHGASEAEIDELLPHTAPAFLLGEAPIPTLPLPDEPFVAAWTRYADAADRLGTVAALKQCLVQLRFPIRPDMHATDAYRRATRSLTELDPPGVDGGVTFDAPDALTLSLIDTPAGRLPVLQAGARADFVRLVQALTRRNRPEPIPESMGALLVSGYRNWDRIRCLHDARAQDVAGRYTTSQWVNDFSSIQSRPAQYQDRFVLASSGAYSAISAASLGLSPSRWTALSAAIRRHHESAHYVTLRAFSSLRTAFHDELLADYHGLTSATGRFDAHWFLHFMGLEEAPAYRTSGRLENYRGSPPLSDGAFRVLQSVGVRAAQTLEAIDTAIHPEPRGPEARAAMLTTLALCPVETLADEAAEEHVAQAYRHVQTTVDRSPADRSEAPEQQGERVG